MKHRTGGPAGKSKQPKYRDKLKAPESVAYTGRWQCVCGQPLRTAPVNPENLDFGRLLLCAVCGVRGEGGVSVQGAINNARGAGTIVPTTDDQVAPLLEDMPELRKETEDGNEV